MKTPLLGLMVATTAFAGSSLYLWVQLDEERERAAQVEASAQKLNARIAELEKARDEFERRRLEGPPAFAGKQPVAAASISAQVPPVPARGDAENSEARQVWSNFRPDRSPAFQKMMRSQVRANTRRQYADVGEKLGLSKEKAARLIDLLAEQQAAMMVDSAEPNESGQLPFDFEQRQREYDMAVSDLIGADKVMQLKEFQESLPARQEFEMIARQLDDYGTPLSESQRKRLVEVVIEARRNTPMPSYSPGMDDTQYAKSVNDWKNDYDKRVADQASQILTLDQLTVYNEIQQLQKEMREQFAVSAVGVTGPNARMRRVVGGNAVTINAAPVYVQGAVASGVTLVKEEEQKKP